MTRDEDVLVDEDVSNAGLSLHFFSSMSLFWFCLRSDVSKQVLRRREGVPLCTREEKRWSHDDVLKYRRAKAYVMITS